VIVDSGADLSQAGESGTTGTETTQSLDGNSGITCDVDEQDDRVKLMVDYFYQLDYTLAVDGTGSAAIPLSQPETLMIDHIAIFDLAVKYQIDGLRDLAAEKFKLSAETNWKHKDFVDAINAIPQHNSDLRDIVLDILCEHIDTALDNKEIDALLRVNSRLAYDLLKRVRKVTVAADE
jgi:hypothetical protein